MEWLDRMKSAMDYIETHLDEEVDPAEAAKRACCSVTHFQRMFSFITGIHLSEYIRSRRQTLAGFEQQEGSAKEIDVALKYGYDSPEAFSRAFKQLHGIMPTAARSKGAALKAFPRLSFHISIRGDVEMNYRIEEKQPFKMAGLTADRTWTVPTASNMRISPRCGKRGLQTVPWNASAPISGWTKTRTCSMRRCTTSVNGILRI